MASHAVSETDRRELARRNPALARSVSALDSLEAVEVLPGRRGRQILSHKGIRLASAYDPEGEAARRVDPLLEPGADLCVLLGLGLGHELDRLRSRSAAPILVYEPSTERLAALLALRPGWDALSDERVHWASDAEELAAFFGSRYAAGLKVCNVVHPAVRQLDSEALRTALAALARVKDADDLGAGTRVRMSAAWAQQTVDNSFELLATPRFSQLAGAFQGMPAVVVAAGPSLDRQLERLAREAPRLLVIAIGQSLRPLRQAGVAPDLVHVIESQDVAHQISLAGDSRRENLVLAPSAHPALFALPVATRFVHYPVTNPMGQWIAESLGESTWIGGGSTVAQSAVRLAASLGADPILLLGQDLAFSGGRVYAKGSAYDMLALREADDGSLVYTGVRQKADLFGDAERWSDERAVDTVWVEGWSGGRVPTSRSYATFLAHYRGIGEYLASHGVRLWNCSEGGARIPGLEHHSFDEALSRCPDAPAKGPSARQRIESAWSEAPPVACDAPRRQLGSGRRAVRELEREVERAAKELVRARRIGPHSDAIGALRALSRCERRVKRALKRVPWFDALVAADLQRGVVRARQACEPESEQEGALDQAEALFETVRAGLEPARFLLDRFEEHTRSFEDSRSPEAREAPAPRPSGRAEVR